MPIIPINVGVANSMSAADETSLDRLKVNSAIRFIDQSQSSGSQLVAAKGDQANGLWVNVKATSLPAGAATEATLAKLAIPLGTAIGSNTQIMVGGSTSSAAPSYVDGNVAPMSLTTDGRLRVEIPTGASGLTDAELRAVAVPVSLTSVPSHAVTNAGTFAVQAVQSGTWNVTNVSGTVSLPTGAATEAKQPSLGTAGTASANVITVQGIASMTALKVDGSAVTQPVSGTFWQATQPVSGTFWQATQPVSGTFWQATQPVSGPLTDAQLRATAVPVSGTVTANIGTSGSLTLESTQVKLTIAQNTALGSNTLAMVGGAVLTAQPSYTTGNINPLSITPGGGLRVEAVHTGKANVCKTGNLVTTAVTADQVILTYTVTAGKTFFLMGIQIQVRLTTYAATALPFGAASLESPAATKLNTFDLPGTGNSMLYIPFGTPIEIAAGAVVRIVCTPLATTSYTWKANFFGYEK